LIAALCAATCCGWPEFMSNIRTALSHPDEKTCEPFWCKRVCEYKPHLGPCEVQHRPLVQVHGLGLGLASVTDVVEADLPSVLETNSTHVVVPARNGEDVLHGGEHDLGHRLCWRLRKLNVLLDRAEGGAHHLGQRSVWGAARDEGVAQRRIDWEGLLENR
jgi:hypothetical protein